VEIVVISEMPRDTFVLIPKRRTGETLEEWSVRFVVVTNVESPKLEDKDMHTFDIRDDKQKERGVHDD
jgi:hypothetical protein